MTLMLFLLYPGYFPRSNGQLSFVDKSLMKTLHAERVSVKIFLTIINA